VTLEGESGEEERDLPVTRKTVLVGWLSERAGQPDILDWMNGMEEKGKCCNRVMLYIIVYPVYVAWYYCTARKNCAVVLCSLRGPTRQRNRGQGKQSRRVWGWRVHCAVGYVGYF
jgi:hypothetical protein